MFSFLLCTTISTQCKEWNEFCISCMYIHATALLETGQPALHFQGGGGGGGGGDSYFKVGVGGFNAGT